MSRQPPTVMSASTSSAAPWAFTQVHGPLDGTLVLEMEPAALRTEPTRQTDARTALAERGGMLSARDRLVLDGFLIRGKHP